MIGFKQFLESADIFDARNGIGAVPNNQEIDYKGFVKEMSPDEFRRLVPYGVSGDETKDYVIDALKEGKKLGQPFLLVEWSEDNKVWFVKDHEGRSRMDAIAEVYGQISVPVHIFPRSMRARDITDEHRNAIFIPQS
jgi:hypothetical protein